MTKVQRSSRVLFPIAVKLVTIITAIVLVSLVITTVLITIIIRNDIQITAEDNNFTLNQRSASETEDTLSSVRMNTLLFLDILAFGSATTDLQDTAAVFFSRNKAMAGVLVPGKFSFLNERFFSESALDTAFIDPFLKSISEQVSSASRGDVSLHSAASFCDFPLLALVYPIPGDGAGVTLFSAEALAEVYGTGTNTTVLVNGSGTILVSPDLEQMSNSQKISGEIIQLIETSQEQRKQLLVQTETEDALFTAISKLSFTDASVVTTIPYKIVFESIQRTTIRNIFLGFAVLFLSILLVWFFSKTISAPVHLLAAAAVQIKNGEFLLEIKPSTRDELGMLTESFVQMGKGLAERENLKESFGRFTNKEVAERALKGELTLGGESKFVTIFFSDIRSFTALSENMEPADLVEFLNDYMTAMVSCITETGGSVDKFIGDAIMAVWGAVTSTVSIEENALNSIRASLKMRANLIDYNRARIRQSEVRGQGLIRRAEEYVKPKDFSTARVAIGCGINSGSVIAGQIGSTERMEYTVIGDAVNLASRTESLNKPFCTDILITENTYKLVSDFVTVEEMPPVSVKGKSKSVRMFAVVNMPSAEDIPYAGADGPKNMKEVRLLVGMSEPNLAGVNANEEEKKYTISG